MEHVLSCGKGGFPSLHHNEIRDYTAFLLTEVCSNVAVEPTLQSLNGEVLSGASANRDDNAQVYIAAEETVNACF